MTEQQKTINDMIQSLSIPEGQKRILIRSIELLVTNTKIQTFREAKEIVNRTFNK